MFSINGGDFVRGLVVAIIAGVLLPISAMIQTPGFDIATIQWSAVMNLALNGGITAFIAYMSKNFFSSEGKFLGRLG